MSKLTTLQTAVSGLNAAQANLYVTGHNMANVNAPGYVRQQIVQNDSFYGTIGQNHTGKMQVGLGTNISTLRQIRDKFLDMAYRTSSATLGFYNVRYNVGLNVEATIGELEGEYKLQSVLQDLKDSIGELGNDPTDIATRGEFITTCIVFMDKANETYDSLRSQQDNLNGQIISMTKRINTLLNTINDCCKSIAKNELTGDSANDYRDEMNMALDELSQYVNISYTFKPDKSVNIFCDGVPLLTNGVCTSLGLRYCSPDSNLVEVVITNRTDTLRYDEDAKLFFSYDRDISPAAKNDGGALKGLLVSRGLRPGSYVDSPDQITKRHNDNMSVLNAQLAAATSFSARSEALEKIRLAELQYKRDMFNANNCLIPQAQLQLDTLVHSIVTLINDAFSPRQEIMDPVTGQGTGVYKKLDPNDYPYGLDGTQDFMEIFVRSGSDYRYNDASGTIRGEDDTDYYSLYTIGNFTINPALRYASGYRLMTLSPSGDVHDNTSILQLLKDWDSEFIGIDGDTKLSVNNFYRRIISNISIDVNACKTISESESDVLNQTDGARLQISGVSLDEEMTSMLKFQHSYNAAARLLNYIDSMLDRVINRTGRVGL